MDRGRTELKLLAAVLALGIVLLLLAGRREAAEHATTQADTVRVTVTDTVRCYQPVAHDSTVVRYVTVRVPAKPEATSETTGTPAERDTDSCTVRLPITQRTYRGASYTAWVSGYEARLDSIETYATHETVTVTQRRRARWHLGLTGGYGLTPHGGLQPYVGIGLTYSLIAF